MAKLHEILAVERDREAAASAVLQETKTVFAKKAEHFLGHHTIYKPFDEEAMDADESEKTMDTTVGRKLAHCFSILGRALDVQATKDGANQEAKADVVVGDTILLEKVPATTLLMLEDRIKSWLNLFREIPTLAPGRHWVLDSDAGEGVYRDDTPESQFRTKKTRVHKVICEATEHHPAQIDAWQEDERIGRITKTTWSGMMSPSEKSDLIQRTQGLLEAVKEARQRANSQNVKQQSIAAPLINYILK